MEKNTLTSGPTGGDGGEEHKFPTMNTDISSVLQDKKIIEDPKRIKTFEREVSRYILTLCLKETDEMETITKDELVEMLKKKFIKNFRKMTQSTANKKIEEAVNTFMINRVELLKLQDGWTHFIEEVIEIRREARYGTINADFLEELKRRHKLKLAESELNEIIDDTNKAKDIMRNLDKYVLNLELAKTLAKAGVFHLSDLFPSVYVDSRDHVHLIGVDYPDFGITKDGVTYLCDLSQKIYKEKKLKHSIFDFEDKIDKYFGK